MSFADGLADVGLDRRMVTDGNRKYAAMLQSAWGQGRVFGLPAGRAGQLRRNLSVDRKKSEKSMETYGNNQKNWYI